MRNMRRNAQRDALRNARGLGPFLSEAKAVQSGFLCFPWHTDREKGSGTQHLRVSSAAPRGSQGFPHLRRAELGSATAAPSPGLTSPLATAGSSALLMWQPSTGVCGEEDKAMLSSLLNISDSVPPAHNRWPTTSHFFFLRDLSGQKAGLLESQTPSSGLGAAGGAPAAVCCCSHTGRDWEHPSPMDRDLRQLGPSGPFFAHQPWPSPPHAPVPRTPSGVTASHFLAASLWSRWTSRADTEPSSALSTARSSSFTSHSPSSLR